MMRQEAHNDSGTSVGANGLLWFGAAISIAEILTGTFIAPLGIAQGSIAILLGHLIGCSVLFFAGYIGARTRRCAMDTVSFSFGRAGSAIFASMNVVQLVGWTAIMISSGASAAHTLYTSVDMRIWCCIIAALIVVWLVIGIDRLGKLNVLVVGALAVLVCALTTIVAGGVPVSTGSGSMSFGAAVELSATMPISWLPLISDYTSRARRPLPATFMSVGAYFVGSCWMFIIGLGATLMFGQSDIALIMVQAGLGVAGVLVVILSTVTTTFLDACSAGVSSSCIWHRIDRKKAAIAACLVGMLMAITLPVDNFESFLYLIGSVFVPMVSILVVDYFVFHRDVGNRTWDWPNMVLWGVGFILYRLALYIDTPVGSTFPVMLIVAGLCLGVGCFRKRFGKESEDARGSVHECEGGQTPHPLHDELRDGQ